MYYCILYRDTYNNDISSNCPNPLPQNTVSHGIRERDTGQSEEGEWKLATPWADGGTTTPDVIFS